ncbi:MAG: RNA polymerase sigma factor [Alphaproteobacteria bacterium]|nr:RNA polymerase sigma factor [Alphaproteobacteria bacterium]
MDFTEDELRDLYDRYAPVLLQRCRSILKNEEAAHDAVQETFARVIRNADTFRQQSSPLTWMYRISTNYCLNQIRNHGTRQGKLTANREDIVGAGFVQPDSDERHDHARIMGLLSEADDETRKCVVHTFFDDCTREEVAQLVGLSVPTVRKRINTFLDRARRAFGEAAVASVTLLVALISWSTP